jgi:hypothetical protein
MTPLASYLAKQLIARPKHRENIWVDPHNIHMLRECIDDIHCFEVTACLPMLSELATAFRRDKAYDSDALFEQFAFLPAPKTWIEWVHGSGNRIAVHLEQVPEKDEAIATLFCEMMATNLGLLSTRSGDYYDYGGDRLFPTFLNFGGNNTAPALLSAAHCLLMLINTPKIIGRRQHMPNAGLERRLTRGFRGKSFPLHAWTEILLQVRKPTEIDDGEPHEAHLTGSRALHFVRKHIRIRLGRLEYVSAHWRGDPSLGIKQSRYVVTP